MFRQPPDPFAEEDPVHRTTEERRDEIVNKRLGRGMGGFALAAVVGIAVLFVDRTTGMYLMACTLAIMAGSGFYLLKTLVRRRTRLRRHYGRNPYN